jgi:hypothetical protein
MICFASALVPAAIKAGMKIPYQVDKFESYKHTHPHFYIFCKLQLDRPAEPDEHWENAKVVAAVSNDEITSVTLQQFIDRGFRGLVL